MLPEPSTLPGAVARAGKELAASSLPEGTTFPRVPPSCPWSQDLPQSIPATALGAVPSGVALPGPGGSLPQPGAGAAAPEVDAASAPQ